MKFSVPICRGDLLSVEDLASGRELASGFPDLPADGLVAADATFPGAAAAEADSSGYRADDSASCGSGSFGFQADDSASAGSRSAEYCYCHRALVV